MSLLRTPLSMVSSISLIQEIHTKAGSMLIFPFALGLDNYKKYIYPQAVKYICITKDFLKGKKVIQISLLVKYVVYFTPNEQ